MGNVSDNKRATPSRMDRLSGSSSTPRFGSSPMPTNPDQSSSSLEWFDASESINTSSPSGSVLVAVKVMSKGEIDDFLKEKETHFEPAKFPEMVSRPPTSRFLNTKEYWKNYMRRSLPRSHTNEQTLILKAATSPPLPLPPVTKNEEEEEKEQKEQTSEAEDMKRVVEKQDEEHQEEANVEKEAEEEEVELVVVKLKDEEEEEVEDETESNVDSESVPEEKEAGPSSSLSLSSNTPDVLSDIPSDIRLDSTPTPPPPTSSPSPTFDDEDSTEATPPILTDADMKRQKKRERKKARQLTKEQQLKRQRLQRAEAIKSREERMEREKQQLAEYAAAVARPTVVSTDSPPVLQPKQQQEEEKEKEETEKNVSVVNIILHQEETTSSASFPFETLLPQDFPYSPSSVSNEDPPTSAENSTLNVTYQEIPIISDGVEMVIRVPARESTSEQLDVDGEQVVQVEESDTFEVLVCGERRKVTAFVPRSKQNSISTTSNNEEEANQNSPDSPSSDSAFDIPEHPPVTVPFRDAPIVTTSQHQNQPMRVPPPQFMAVQIPFNPQSQPMLVGPPMINSYGPGPPRFVQMPPPNFGPHQFPPVGMVPVSMSRIPMQRMAPVPVMVNRPQMFIPPHPGPVRMMPAMPLPPSGPPPPPQMSMPPPQQVQQPVPQRPPMQPTPPPSHMVVHQVYPSQRPLVRPTRNPLAITAPPLEPVVHKKKVTEKSVKQEPKKKTTVEKSRKVQKYVEHFKKESKSVPSTSTESTVSENKPIVVAEVSASLEKLAIEEKPVTEEQQAESSPIQAGVSEVFVQSIEGGLKPEKPGPKEFRRSSSAEMNTDLITSGVAAVLDDSDDEFPPITSSSTSSPENPPLMPTSVEQQAALDRVLELTKKAEAPSFDIWAGFHHEMPASPKPPPGFELGFRSIFEDDEKREDGVQLAESPISDDEEEYEDENTKLTLISICKKLEPYFKTRGAQWVGATIDSEQLRGIFVEAYNGKMPREHWSILEKVCSFQPGYFHVFDVLIGRVLELTYKFMSTPEFKQDQSTDSLYSLYQSLPPVEGVEKFFKRFEETILPDLLQFISNRFVSIRTFVAISEVVKDTDLTVSDLYYLAALVFGAHQFYTMFNGRIKQLNIIETGGKRWIRQTMMDELRVKPPFVPGNEKRMSCVADFLSRLRPHIDDILQILPDTVVNDDEFYKAAKLVCGWSGEDEEKIWKSIVNDRAKFQEFHEAYRPFLRSEIRMGSVYLLKLTYEDDDDVNEANGESVNVVTAPQDSNLISAFKSDDINRKEKKKGVSYAAEIELEIPDAPTSGNRSTQTDNMNMDQMWDLEREVIRLLKRDNIPFAEFIQSEDAREMYQFLIDTFKQKNLRRFAFILEKTLIETREEAWKEVTQLREAAEEARKLLDVTREHHRKEFGDLRTRLETIGRFEALEVQADAENRIELLKERIQELTRDREVILREEVKEERARLQRQLKEMKEKHVEEKRLYVNEITRLREENSRLAADREELNQLRKERDEMTARCQSQMNKAKSMCENSSRLLIESQREIEALRNNTASVSKMGRGSLPNTPDSESDSASSTPEPLQEFLPEGPCTSNDHRYPSTSSTTAPLSPIEMSSEARRQMKIMEKYAIEFNADELRKFARDLMEFYNTTKANHKERKTAEKQLKEYEAALDSVENAIKENMEMIKLNVVDGLDVIPEIPQPFSETVLKKMYSFADEEEELPGAEHSISIVEEEEDGCLICTEVVEETSETITCHTCTKEYHYHCISTWLKINSVCPACSRALKDPNEYPMLG